MSADDWTPKFNHLEHWHDAVQTFANRALHYPAVLVVGSGASCERDDSGQWKSGVWDVATILKYIADQYKITPSTDGAEAYGAAMEELSARKGQDVASQVIRRAVLAACSLAKDHPDVINAKSLESEKIKAGCQRLVTGESEQSGAYWNLPPAIVAIARLVKDIVNKRLEQGRNLPPLCVITTNFDELFEVALRRMGMADQYQAFNLVGNQFPHGEGEPIHVWHVHGTWRGQMIHSPSGLTAPRDKLKLALHKCFDGAKALVLGYGGWEDIVFGTLGELLSTEAFNNAPEVFWSSYERDDAEILRRYASVFRRLSPIQARLSARFYKDIDLNLELPKIEIRFEEPAPDSSKKVAFAWSDRVVLALGALANCAPPAHKVTARKYHEEAKADVVVNFCDVVAFCCEAYEVGTETERQPFALAAREVIDAMGLDLHRWVTLATGKPAMPLTAGKVTDVSIKSPVLVEMLLAPTESRDSLKLISDVRGARNPRHIDLKAAGLFERGTQATDWVHKFLALVWKQDFRRDEPFDPARDSEVVKGRLLANTREKRRTVAIIAAGSAEDWAEVAAQVPGATFVKTAGKGAVSFDFDEFELAHLISDFLKQLGEKEEPLTQQ